MNKKNTKKKGNKNKIQKKNTTYINCIKKKTIKKNILFGSAKSTDDFEIKENKVYGFPADDIITLTQPSNMSYERFIKFCDLKCKEKNCHIFTINKNQKGYLKFFKEKDNLSFKIHNYYDIFLEYLINRNIDPLPYLEIELDLNTQDEDIKYYQNSCSSDSVYLKKINKKPLEKKEIILILSDKDIPLRLQFINEEEFKNYIGIEKEYTSLNDIFINIESSKTTDSSISENINYYIPLIVKCIPPAIFYRNEECKCDLRRITSEKIISTDNNYNSFINKKSIIHLTNLLTSLYFSNTNDEIMNEISSKRKSDLQKKDEELLLEVFKQLLIEKFNKEYKNKIECKTIIEEYLEGPEKKIIETEIDKFSSDCKLNNQYYKIITIYLIYILKYIPNYNNLKFNINEQINFIISQLKIFDKMKGENIIYYIFRHFILIYNTYLMTLNNPQIFKINSGSNLTFNNFFINFSKLKSKSNSVEYINTINNIIFGSINHSINKFYKKPFLIQNNELKIGHFLFLDIYKIQEVNQSIYYEYRKYFNNGNSLIKDNNIENVINLLLFIFNILAKFFPNLIHNLYLCNIENKFLSKETYSDLIDKLSESSKINTVGTVWMEISEDKIKYLNPLLFEEEEKRELFETFKEFYQKLFLKEVTKNNNNKIYLPPNISLVENYILILENQDNFDLAKSLYKNFDIKTNTLNEDTIKQLFILEGYNEEQISLIINNLIDLSQKDPLFTLIKSIDSKEKSNLNESIKKLNFMLNSIVIISSYLWILLVKLLELSDDTLKIIPNVCNIIIKYIEHNSIIQDKIIPLTNFITYQILINNKKLGYISDLKEESLDRYNLDKISVEYIIKDIIEKNGNYNILDPKFNEKIEKEKIISDMEISISLYDKFQDELNNYLIEFNVEDSVNKKDIIRWLFNDTDINNVNYNGFYKLFINYKNEYLTIESKGEKFYFIAINKTIDFYSESNIIPNLDGINSLINIDNLLNILLSSTNVIYTFLEKYEEQFSECIKKEEELKKRDIEIKNLRLEDNICSSSNHKKSFMSNYIFISNPFELSLKLLLEHFDIICDIIEKICQQILNSKLILKSVNKFLSYKDNIESIFKQFIESFFIYMFVSEKNYQKNNTFFLFINNLLSSNPNYSNFLQFIVFIKELPKELKIFYFTIINKIFKLVNNFFIYQISKQEINDTNSQETIISNLEKVLNLLKKKIFLKDIIRTFINLINTISKKEEDYKNNTPFKTKLSFMDPFLNINIYDFCKIFWIINHLFENYQSNQSLFSLILNTINTNHFFIKLRIKIDFYLFIDFEFIKIIYNQKQKRKICILIDKDPSPIQHEDDKPKISELEIKLEDKDNEKLKKKICQYNSGISPYDQIIIFNYNTQDDLEQIFKHYDINNSLYKSVFDYEPNLNLQLSKENNQNILESIVFLGEKVVLTKDTKILLLFYKNEIPEIYLRNKELNSIIITSFFEDEKSLDGKEYPYTYFCLKDYYDQNIKDNLFLKPNKIFILSLSDLEINVNSIFYLPDNQQIKLQNIKYDLNKDKDIFSELQNFSKEDEEDWENSYRIFNQDILKVIVFITIKKISKTLYHQIFSEKEFGYFNFFEKYLTNMYDNLVKSQLLINFNNKKKQYVKKFIGDNDKISLDQKNCYFCNLHNLIKNINNYTYYYNILKLDNSFNYDLIITEFNQINEFTYKNICKNIYLNNLDLKYDSFLNLINNKLDQLNLNSIYISDSNQKPEENMEYLKIRIDKFWDSEKVKLDKEKESILKNIKENQIVKIKDTIEELKKISQGETNIVYIKYKNGIEIISIPQILTDQDFYKSLIEKISKIDLYGNLVGNIYES